MDFYYYNIYFSKKIVYIEKKRENYNFYKIYGLDLLNFQNNIRPNYWFFSLITNKRNLMIKHLAENNIQSRPIWHLLHNLPMYLNNQSYKIEKANYYHERIVNIPCSSNLTSYNLMYVIDKIKEIKQDEYE